MGGLLLTLIALGAMAQAPPPPPPPAPPAFDVSVPDSVVLAPVEEAPFATDTLRAPPIPAVVDAYRADPDFQYDTPRAEGPSLMERFWRWFGRTVMAPLFENTSADGRRWVLVLLAVAALGWAFSRILQADGGGVFSRGGAARGEVGGLLDAEDIAEVDLGTRLADALARDDHREAVRVRYLLLLQALDAAGAIAWRRDKTNRQYIAEVRASAADRARPFARATRVFDAVWYGERPVPPALYAKLAPLFDRAAPRLA